MGYESSRFSDEGEPFAIAIEDDDPEAYLSDEDPEPDEVWEIVDSRQDWYTSDAKPDEVVP